MLTDVKRKAHNSDMKILGQEPDLQELYDQNLFNRYYSYKNVNFSFGKSYRLKMMLGAFTLFPKLFLSRFLRPEKETLKSIFIAWSPLHKKRSKDLAESHKLIEFDRFSFSKHQIRHFAPISILEVFKFLIKIKKSEVNKLEKSSLYLSDSLSYRILFVVDYLMLRAIVRPANRVFVAGHGDRATIIISKLCEEHNIEFSILQHGVLGRVEGWRHLKADRFYYLYPFSKPFVQHLIKVTPNTELLYLPKKASLLDLKYFDQGKYELNIGYATSPADSEKDVVIIEGLKQHLGELGYNLLIYPHPVEIKTRYDSLTEDHWVFVSRNRHKNIEYMISRYSTLGIEYYEQGILPVFLNYENIRMDFFEEKAFLVFHDPDNFEKWLERTLKSSKSKLDNNRRPS